MLWVPVTVAAAIAQIARNALQSGLTATVGTLGATMVRFVFAVPFALAAWAVAVWGIGEAVPAISPGTIEWTLAGALAQIGATALMLKSMHMRGFAVAYAYIKTEPVLLAIGGWVLLGDKLPGLAWFGIVLATTGVIWSALPKGTTLAGMRGELGPIAYGVFGGALFGLSSLAFRAAILTLDAEPWMGALHVLTMNLLMQSAIMLVWLWFADRKALGAVFRQWKPSLAAGATGMIASFGWFTGFALTPAANVRTLALIEMPFAALLNRKMSGKHLTEREWIGVSLVVMGILALVQGTV